MSATGVGAFRVKAPNQPCHQHSEIVFAGNIQKRAQRFQPHVVALGHGQGIHSRRAAKAGLRMGHDLPALCGDRHGLPVRVAQIEIKRAADGGDAGEHRVRFPLKQRYAFKSPFAIFEGGCGRGFPLRLIMGVREVFAESCGRDRPMFKVAIPAQSCIGFVVRGFPKLQPIGETWSVWFCFVPYRCVRRRSYVCRLNNEGFFLGFCPKCQPSV
jgi:hypothetical protein